MKNPPLISIIVPVYNSQQYLHRCIDSILSQSYKDFELILVDDGSTDNSGVICDTFAKADNRVKVIHQKNKGVSTARNRGIEEVCGKWCCFIDSDDWLEVSYLQNFVEKMEPDVDLLMQGFYINDLARNRTNIVKLPNTFFNNTHEVVCFLEDYPGVHNGFLWHKLFKLELIHKNNILFHNDLSFAEDGLFFFTYMKYVSFSISTDKCGYHYLIRSNSLTSKSKQLPLEQYSFLLRNYISELLEFKTEPSIKTKHESFVHRYACRLLISWFIETAWYRPKEKSLFLRELKLIDSEYQILDTKEISLVQKIVIFGTKIPMGIFQDFYMKSALWINKQNNRVKRFCNRFFSW